MDKKHEAKNQHFVPQFYFRQFSVSGKIINALQKKNGTRIRGNVSIADQCSKDYFYGIGKIDSAITQFEGVIADTFHSIIETAKFPINTDPKFRINLQFATVLQYWRTMQERYRSLDAYGQVLKLHLEASIRNSDSSDKQKLIDGLPKLKINLPPQDTHLFMLRNYFAGHMLLCDLNCVLVENMTSKEFIFSDSPTILFNQALNRVENSGDIGFASPGLQIFYPISPKYLIVFYDGKIYKAINKNAIISTDRIADINQLNSLQILNADKTIYFSEDTPHEGIRQLWERLKSSFHSPQLYREIRNQGPETTELIAHMMNKSFQFKLNLSFLEKVRLRNSQTIPMIRSEACYIAYKGLLANGAIDTPGGMV